jgi:hypothetical protein
METSDTVGKPYLGVHQTGSRPIVKVTHKAVWLKKTKTASYKLLL